MQVLWPVDSLLVSSMARSNPSALKTGLIGHSLDGYPLPEKPNEPLVDEYLENAAAQYFVSSSVDESSSATPVMSVSHSGSLSGRCSTYSWGADEGELDRLATETVRRMFAKINGALYEGKSVGTTQVDKECREWRSNFPHFEVRGIHLLDTMDDGTEMVAPDPFVTPQSSNEVLEATLSQGLTIVGYQIHPKELSKTSPVHEYLHEEIVAADGIIEEYFAFDNTDEHSLESRKRSRLKRHHGLPPVTPNACVREAVCNQVFDQIWNEVTAILQPLIPTIKKKVLSGRNSRYSLGGPGTPSGSSPLGIDHMQHQPYILRGLRDQPTLRRAYGQSGSQYLRFKHSASTNVPAPTLPQLTTTNLTSLKDVMQIRSVSLQQRATSSYVPNVMHMPVDDPGQDTFYGRPESSTAGSRLGKYYSTPLPPRTSDYQLPTTPATNRLLSSCLTRRNINMATLRPLEKPKTPGLIPIDDGIRGYKLYTHGSPPSTPYVRNTQLPPLESTYNNTMMERSPPIMRSRNRVTFSSRILSAADGQQDHWKLLSRPSGSDLRPNTTNTFRADVAKLVGRKTSDHSMSGGSMKVVGHAAGRDLGIGWSSIAEDDEEVLEEDNISFTITGTSGFFQPKPRSGRTKLRGHNR